MQPRRDGRDRVGMKGCGPPTESTDSTDSTDSTEPIAVPTVPAGAP